MDTTAMAKRALGMGAALLVILTVVPVVSAGAQTSTTVPCSGNGGGSAGLIAAISAANSGGGGTITLASGCTYSLTVSNNGTAGPMGLPGFNGLPVVTSAITIGGNGATIAANNSTFRIFEVDGPGGNLTLQDVILTGGNAAAGGALLNVEGSVTLDQSVVTANTGQTGGGGIASGVVNPAHLGPIGTLTLNDSKVDGNAAMGGGGGGILNHAGTLSVTSGSEVDNNTSAGGGGGIASGNGNGGAPGTGGATLVITSSQVDGNTSTGGPADGAGGVANGGTATITSSQINSNSAPGSSGGGILNHGVMTISSSTVESNTAATDASGDPGFGGGISNLSGGFPGSGVLSVTGSQIVNNTASGVGGGIFEAGFTAIGPFGTGGPLALSSTQVTGNVSGAGGGIYANIGSEVTLAATSVLGANTTSDCAGKTGNAAFVCAAYEDLLGRTPDAAGNAAFLAQLSKGVSRATVAYVIATSNEFWGDLVDGIYAQYLGRTPDAASRASWIKLLSHGVSDARVLETVLGSPEFFANAGGTNDGFVNALYLDLLGRPADPAGLSHWTGLLSSGASRDSVAFGIEISREFLSNLIGTQYLILLDRSPNADAAGVAFWVSHLLSGTSFERVLGNIIGSPQFLAVNT